MRNPWLPLLMTPLLAGCGQKGPLFLPDKNPAAVTTPAQPVATPAAAPAAAKKSADEDASQAPAPK